jgi:DNA-binding IclR family transcriptional regulator
MGRTTNLHKLQTTAELIRRQPGKRPGEYARELGMHRQAFHRLLPQMEEHDIYLYEDDEGRLWPWKMPG